MEQTFFGFNEERRKGILEEVFYLVHWGFSEWYLYNIPVSDFRYLIQLYNKHQKDVEKEHKKNSKSSSNNKSPKPVGANIPRKQ